MENQSSNALSLSSQENSLGSTQDKASPWNLVLLMLLEGPLQEEQLQQALGGLVSRHEVLRTVFRSHTEKELPFQITLGTMELAWESVDLSALDSTARQKQLEDLFCREQERQCNLDRGPVVSATLIRLATNRRAFLLSVPALLGDLNISSILMQELGSIYAGTQQRMVESSRDVQFSQQGPYLCQATEENAQSAKSFWSQQAAADRLVLPEEFAARGLFRPRSVTARVQGLLLEGIDSAAKKYRASPEGILLAAWQALIWRLTGQNSFQTRVFFSGRELKELESTPGLAGKFFPIPTRFDGDLCFNDVVQHVQGALDNAAQWRGYFVPGYGMEELPVAFECTQLPARQIHGDVTFQVLRHSACTEPYRLKLSAQRGSEGLTLDLGYDASRLERATIERWMRHFQTLLAGAIENPETAVSLLPLLTEGERRQVLEEWNQTAVAFPRDLCIHDLFEAQAERTPDRVAVRFGEETISYRELSEQANQLAHHLRRLGVGAGSLVGLCVDRGVWMVVGLVAILKAGGAYVPLDEDNPKPRLAQQLADVVALVTEAKFDERIPEVGGPRVCIDRDGSQWSGNPRSNLGACTNPENLVYVIFTSGSTGHPKGVAVRHRNLVNYVNFIQRRLELEKEPEGWHFATVSTLSADLGNTCIFPALASGGCLDVISEEVALDSARLSRHCRQHPVDVLKIVPSHLEALLGSSEGAGLLPRKYLILGGEALTMRLVQRIRDLGGDCEIGNHYGPTETTVESVVLRLSDYAEPKGREQTVPIGRPVDNTQIYILDSHLEPVPLGVVGELYIAGEGVAAGYLNQPQLTAERFISHPFLANGTMYRTGDLCRYLPNGNVEFLGRADDQIKIRGFRVELDEIEAALTRHPSVKQAVIVAKKDARGDKRLVAYVVGPSGTEELRTYLREQLPEYMVPSPIIPLPKLPLSANGKVDRRSLPEPEQFQNESQPYVAPRTDAEKAIAVIWSEVLGNERIGRGENFFEIGGHSLAGIQVISRIIDHFDVKLDVGTIFDWPTIEGLAEAIEIAKESGVNEPIEAKIVAVPREQYRLR